MRSGKRVVVTGGSGFLGSHLCERLLDLGCDVLCVDNFYTGRKANILHLLDNPYFELMRHDITFPLYVEAEEIYNMACPASPIHYQYDPVQTTKTTVHGAINMLGLAKRIRACYDEGKRCAETLFFDYHRQHKLKIKVGRIFNTYGPRIALNDGRVVSNFIVQALRNEPLTVYGDGSQTRSFCYVDDLIEAMIRLMATEDSFTGPVNLGNPGEFTILELARTVLKLTGSKSKIVRKPLPENDPLQRRPDIGLARRVLKWEPTTPLEAGLVKTIDYFRTVLGVGKKGRKAGRK